MSHLLGFLLLLDIIFNDISGTECGSWGHSNGNTEAKTAAQGLGAEESRQLGKGARAGLSQM